jgi:8-oxo-dGTP pyrophosphatase MutT (NUDIX family)
LFLITAISVIILWMQIDLRQIFSTRPKRVLNDNGRMMSAVMVPVFYKDSDYHVLFTKRSFKVANHQGQVSFPGGAYSEGDDSLMDTALRESWEEIGLKPEDVDIIGELDDAITTTSNYIIKPYIAIIPYPYDFKVSASEISEMFDVPLSHLMNEMNFKEERNEGDDGFHKAFYYKYKGKIIWGATAYILKRFLDTIKAACEARR